MIRDWFIAAVAYQQSGNISEAKRLYENILAAEPRHGASLHNLGLIDLGAGQPEAALPRLKAAWTSDRRHQQFLSSLIDALLSCGRFSEAHEFTLRAAKHGVHKSLLDAARSRIAAARQEPHPLQHQVRRLVALFNAQKFDEMEGWSRALKNAAPACGFYWKSHGTALRMMNRPAEAHASLKTAASLAPEDAELKNILGTASRDLGLTEEAEAAYRAALELDPRSFDAHYNLSVLLQLRGDWAESELHARTAITLAPEVLKAKVLLATALTGMMRHDEARMLIEAAAGEIASTISVAAGVEGTGGTPANSSPAAFVQFTDQAYFYGALLFQGGYLGLWTGTDYLARARKWEALPPMYAAPARDSRSFIREPRFGRRLRVGYVSMDFRKHSVAQFIVGLLQQHDRTRVEIFLYSTNAAAQNDAVTTEIRASCDHWRECRPLTLDGFLTLVDQDQIDVLIDLAGYTDGNGLRAFARRAAPVQCHYLGYFASTGLSEMDYWIGDGFAFGEGAASSFSEKLWRLPRTWMAFNAPVDAPEIKWAPKPGELRFATFNAIGKITGLTLDVWSELLQALPESRLTLKAVGFENQKNREPILAAFQQRGVEPGRFNFIGKEGNWQRHMELYNDVDIALDPIGGLSGGTTTCEALWMGVPVISLAGNDFAQRMSADFLHSIGADHWVTQSTNEYIARAVDLARNLPGQADRIAQREAMAQSSLCDVRGLARALDDAYEEMFDVWSAS